MAGKGALIDEMRAVDPDLVEHETQLLSWAVRQVAEKPPRVVGRWSLVATAQPTRRPCTGWVRALATKELV